MTRHISAHPGGSWEVLNNHLFVLCVCEEGAVSQERDLCHDLFTWSSCHSQAVFIFHNSNPLLAKTEGGKCLSSVGRILDCCYRTFHKDNVMDHLNGDRGDWVWKLRPTLKFCYKFCIPGWGDLGSGRSAFWFCFCVETNSIVPQVPQTTFLGSTQQKTRVY